MHSLKICLAMPIFDQHEAAINTLRSYYKNAKHPEDISLILIDNGSTIPISKWLWKFQVEFQLINIRVICNSENLGVTKALNQVWESVKNGCCNPDYILYTHSDVTILESDWDVRLIEFLTKHEDTGVVGFGGAVAIGIPDMYKYPYQKALMQRIGFFSNMSNAEAHGFRMEHEYEPCAVLDGFTLCVKTELLNKCGGFDDYYIFHMYDNDICLQSIEHGYKNYILGISCTHLGGVTSTKPDYQDWAGKYGGDIGIHNDSHLYFYNKWRGVIPYIIPGMEINVEY